VDAGEGEEVTECDHALTEFCSCIPRRPPAYVAPHVQMRGPGERLPQWRCTCPGLKPWKRHRSEIDCLPAEDVARFKAAHGLRDAGLARSLLFLEQFKPRLKFGVERGR
jgi:hypothetical protein